MEAETSEALSKAEIQHFNTNDLEMILKICLKDHTHRSSPCPVAKYKAKPQSPCSAT